ncbi:hypothetical protein KIN20_023271 [Parelaphostrongylus tenuis]|uniref:Uncharacterized protein n=1 Tax=Parelaphostrongylus tenuis TaxID=148309 RepID=A0AAD5MWL7_PARTN|nr:hypothetical protein KIN20_023271 [Parelaphostrongylus tenuis]
MERIMREGKQLEVEMLFLITQNPSDWLKMPRTEDFIEVLCKFLDVIRESNTLQFMWRETFLNEMHSETECFLRRIIFKDSQDEESTKREKQLMNLLIFIIDEKAKLSERNLDGRAKDTAAMQKKELKKLRHSLLMILLSKKK